MRNLFCLLLLAFGLLSASAQIKATILDETTKEPIPYVNIWVEGENIGTSANENGVYSLPKTDSNKTVIFSAVGYAEAKIKFVNLTDFITLYPKAIVLDELLIQQRKNQNKYIVNRMENIDETYFATSCAEKNPLMFARHIPYKEIYAKTPFLSEIKFLTHSDVRNAIFYVRLYSVNNDGSPGELLHDKPIIGKAISKKRSLTAVDVSKIGIKIPEKGIFVAIEWLIIKRNEFIVYTSGSGKKGEIYYTPKFKNVYTRNNIARWIYQRGEWKQVQNLHNNKFYTFAVELTLTD